MRKLIYVANWGTSREFIRDPRPAAPNTRRGGSGSGKFVPPSITVYPANADQTSRRCASSRGRRPASTGRRTSPSTRSAASSTSQIRAATRCWCSTSMPRETLRRFASSKARAPNCSFRPACSSTRPMTRCGREFRWPHRDRLRQDAKGDAAPKRVIRSAPRDEPPRASATVLDRLRSRREEVIVPSCVANPQIGMFSRTADKTAAPTRRIAGQNSKLNRTVHGVNYDEGTTRSSSARRSRRRCWHSRARRTATLRRFASSRGRAPRSPCRKWSKWIRSTTSCSCRRATRCWCSTGPTRATSRQNAS